MAEIEVFFYSVNAQDLEWLTPQAASFMSTEELDRWQRFRVAEPANVFIASRYLMRKLLAERLNCSAPSIEFVVGEHGKPSLLAPAANWYFNLSHSRNLVAFAIAEGRGVGIDVEAVVTRKALEGLAEQTLTSSELAHFLSLDEPARQDFFTRAWVLKESYIKLMGKGVWHGLSALAVDVSIPEILGETQVVARYLDAPGNFRAALCYLSEGKTKLNQEKTRPKLVLRTLQSLSELGDR